MNPLLPIVLALTGVGLLGCRREIARAWWIGGLAATALLLPVLLRPDGIPSPSGTLADAAPWRGAVDGATANPDLGDVTFQVEPWLLFLRQELRAGRLPFWNPHQSAGAPFWSNGSSAPLHPFHLLFALLPLQAGFVLLPWLRLAVGGAGAYVLARELGVGTRAAPLAAIVFALSGRFAAFLLYPMANALCLVPWVFLAVERIAAGRAGAWRGLALLAGLQLLAGHPETPVFSGLAATVYLLVRGSASPWRAWGLFALGWATGLALAAVAILPLALTLFETSRWQEWSPGPGPRWSQILALWSRFLLPDALGHPLGSGYRGPFAFVPSNVYVGVPVLALAALAAFRDRTDRRWLGWAVTVVACLAGATHLPLARHLLYALPVIRKGLHHYLLLGVMLGLAVLAARGLDRWLLHRDRGLGGILAVVGVAMTAVWVAFAGEWRANGELLLQGLWTTWIVLGLGFLLAGRWMTAGARRHAALVLVALLAVELAGSNGRLVPVLAVADLYPPTGAVEFLEGRSERVAAPGVALRPNAAMVYGLYDVRGDDSLKLRWYEALYAAELGGGHPNFFRPLDRWRSPYLDRLGVRWVLAPTSWRPPVAEWTRAYLGSDAAVWERPGAWPLVRWQGEDEARGLEVAARRPGRWEISWSAPRPRAIEIAETWDAGWSATVEGRTAAIERTATAGMAVAVPAGTGRLTLAYRPAGLRAGLAMTAGAIFLLAGTAWWGRARRPSVVPEG